jgi:hypothetical protein
MFHPDGRPKLPGQDHAEAVAAALSAVAAKVRVLDLKKVWPDMPLKGDVSNWLDNGGTVDAFYALVDSVLAWAPAARPEPVSEDSGPREFAPLADEAPIGQPIGEGVERSDFQAFMPDHAYILSHRANCGRHRASTRGYLRSRMASTRTGSRNF